MTGMTARHTLSLMATNLKPTAFRLGDEDRAFIARLQEMTGLDSAASAVRLAVRESVALREQVMPPKPTKPTKGKR